MKTFRFFLLVFAALFLGVNFTACEDEEETEILNDSNEPESVIDENVEDTLPRERRLTEMKIVKNNLTDDPNFKPSSSTYKFSYDNMGRLILCEIINSKGVTTSTEIYSWKENSIVCEIMEKDGNDKLITFQLENNLISNLNSKYKNNGENYIQEFSFAYDSMNHLVKQHKKYGTKDSSTYNYKWRDDKIQEESFEDYFDRYFTNYTYSEETFNGYLPIFAVVSSLSYIHPELFGVKTNSLLTRESLSYTSIPAHSNTEYTYTMNAEGYVESYSEKTVFYFGCHDDTPTIYGYTTFLKWE
ncbi:MAG: hypothetical protein U0L67_04535 [Paludibacteraceae bacterium]|jgi:hypothetical protein|nr:hypothetical protein [Paludibacteraceae bacterium]MEE0911695.1 hypothetical protein [Paludibacteraceae bacterium]